MTRTASDAPTAANRRFAAADRPTFSLALTVPFESRELDGPPSEDKLDQLEHANSSVLAMLLKGADLGAAPVEDEALAEALEPIRVKLDMVVEMVARLSYRDLVLPEARAVEVGLSHLRWIQAESLPVGGWLVSRIYFHDVFREPVTLAGRVAAATADRDGQFRIEVDLAQMSDALAESLGRLVFLEHRRQLANRAGRAPLTRGQR
jgi:hypothetical protein